MDVRGVANVGESHGSSPSPGASPKRKGVAVALFDMTGKQYNFVVHPMTTALQLKEMACPHLRIPVECQAFFVGESEMGNDEPVCKYVQDTVLPLQIQVGDTDGEAVVTESIAA